MPAPATLPAPPSSTRQGALEAWLCALLTALLWRLEPIAHLLPDNDHSYPAPDAESRRWIRAAIRRANRIRAWIGWILRFKPGRGMRRTFARLAPPTPVAIPRAPPRAP
jgi:hypothetical protein